MILRIIRAQSTFFDTLLWNTLIFSFLSLIFFIDYFEFRFVYTDLPHHNLLCFFCFFERGVLLGVFSKLFYHYFGGEGVLRRHDSRPPLKILLFVLDDHD